MRFEALELSIDLVGLLRPLVARLRSRDPDLYAQIRKAASSVPMNLEEGSGRFGKDRRYHFRIAHGSAREVRGALRVSVAWGDLDARETRPALELVERVIRILWGLSR